MNLAIEHMKPWLADRKPRGYLVNWWEFEEFLRQFEQLDRRTQQFIFKGQLFASLPHNAIFSHPYDGQAEPEWWLLDFDQDIVVEAN